MKAVGNDAFDPGFLAQASHPVGQHYRLGRLEQRYRQRLYGAGAVEFQGSIRLYSCGQPPKPRI